MCDVFRGVVEVRVVIKDQYGNPKIATKRFLTKPYRKKGVAAQQATVNAKRHKDVINKYVERAVEWERLD